MTGMRRQAVRLVSGTGLERAARSGYSACRALLPAAMLPVDDAKARVYDRQTVEIARRVLPPSGNSIDAGAHCGGILRHLLRLSPQGEHWAFEPIPNLARQLRRRFPRARVEQIALADFSGTAEFRFLPDAAAYSSLLNRVDVETGQPVQVLAVNVRRLDDVIPPELPIALIKIDVEGAEAAVLRGAERLLRRHHPVVIFECAPARLADCVPALDGAGMRLWLPADFIAGKRRRLDEVMSIGRERHEFCYVASSE
jgi:FkbM family methyltransferase